MTQRKCRWLYDSACVLATAGITVVVVAWVVAGELVAPANRTVGPPPDSLPVVSTSLVSQSGSSIATWLIDAEDAHATVILLHPIRADRRSMWGRAQLLHDAGYTVVIIDLQAHGESPGDHITLGQLERFDVQAAVDYASSLHPAHRIGIVGRSLGGAAAVLASPLDVDAMVLESVYPTIGEAIHNRVSMRIGPFATLASPLLLLQLRPRLGISIAELRPIDRIAQVNCPVLVAAGQLDQHTTIAESRRLFEVAQAPKELVVFPTAAHVDLLANDPQSYQSRVVGFLDRHLRPATASADTERVDEATAP